MVHQRAPVHCEWHEDLNAARLASSVMRRTREGRHAHALGRTSAGLSRTDTVTFGRPTIPSTSNVPSFPTIQTSRGGRNHRRISSDSDEPLPSNSAAAAGLQQEVSLPPIHRATNASNSESDTISMDMQPDTSFPVVSTSVRDPNQEMQELSPTDDVFETQEPFLPPVPAHNFDPILWVRLYATSPNEECFGYALARILIEGLVLPRHAVRSSLKYHAGHFNALRPGGNFPSTVEEAHKLVIGKESLSQKQVFYEVCPNNCLYVFPQMAHGAKKNHCRPSHPPCHLCACPTCGGRRFVVWDKDRGIVRPTAGGVYLGLSEGFINLLRAPGYSEKRTAFLDHLKRVSDDAEQPRNDRFHSSPEYERLCQHFDTSDSHPNRPQFTFFTLFWDGLSIARTTIDYSVNVLMIHSEDMFMRDIGVLQYATPVLLTNGPKKKGHPDAHLQMVYADIYRAAYQGLGGLLGDRRFVLSGVAADRPAAEELLGLRGHTNLVGCGFCMGGTGYIGNHTRYYGYNAATTAKLVSKHKPPLGPQPIVPIDYAAFVEEANKAADGSKTALVHRKASILNCLPWLDLMVSATFPVAHILANAVGKKYMNQFSGTKTSPSTLKIPKMLTAYWVDLMGKVLLTHDSGRGCEVFGVHRANMTINDIITSITMYLPLIFSLGFDNVGLTPEQVKPFKFLQSEGELLCLAVRWYYYAWTPLLDENRAPLETFESKTRFAHRNALQYATMVEGSGYLLGLTYGLHAFVTHFTEQELERGGIACTNELWGERALKKVADIAKGRTSSSNVELTIGNSLNLQRSLVSLEQALQDRGLLIDGKSMLGLGDAVFVSNRCVITVQHMCKHADLSPEVRTFLETTEVDPVHTPLYASATLSTGEGVHGDRYTRLLSRTSHFVMYMHQGVAAYGRVHCFYKSAGCAYAVCAIIEVLEVEAHKARGTVVELRSAVGRWRIVPASAIVCKLVVLHDPADGTLLHATECLHVRVSEDC